jgi:predicted nicotinamide N-methyase
LIAALAGAAAVVATDYGTETDDALVVALRGNADALAALRPADAPQAAWCDVQVCAHVWGTDVAPLLARIAHLSGGSAGGGGARDVGCGRRFDRIILADLLFNRQSHALLLTTCAVRPRREGSVEEHEHTHTRARVLRCIADFTCVVCVVMRAPQACLAPGGVVWVAYSHHDPAKAALDNNFFVLAKAAPFRFAVRHVREVPFAQDVFTEGDGLDLARAMVHFYELTRGGGEGDAA